MGMFDTIVVKCDFPRKELAVGEELQTKSFDCMLDEYTIDEDRHLLDSAGDLFNYTGELEFHAYHDVRWIALVHRGHVLVIKWLGTFEE